jgi:hypothetical protein
MAKTTKWQVDRAFKKAARAELQAKFDKLKATLNKTPLSDDAKRAKIKAEMVQAKYEKDKIRVRRKNGNGAKKKGLF